MASKALQKFTNANNKKLSAGIFFTNIKARQKSYMSKPMLDLNLHLRWLYHLDSLHVSFCRVVKFYKCLQRAAAFDVA